MNMSFYNGGLWFKIIWIYGMQLSVYYYVNTASTDNANCCIVVLSYICHGIQPINKCSINIFIYGCASVHVTARATSWASLMIWSIEWIVLRLTISSRSLTKFSRYHIATGTSHSLEDRLHTLKRADHLLLTMMENSCSLKRQRQKQKKNRCW